MTTITALVHASFAMRGDYEADLQFRSPNNPEWNITVIHEHYHGVTEYEMAGPDAFSPVINVDDAETLTIVVRAEGRVIGCAVLEVVCDQVEELGILLVPHCVSNMILEQRQADEFVRIEPADTTAIMDAVNAGIDRIAREASLTVIKAELAAKQKQLEGVVR